MSSSSWQRIILCFMIFQWLKSRLTKLLTIFWWVLVLKKAETPTSCAPSDTMSMSLSSFQRIILGFMIFQWLVLPFLMSVGSDKAETPTNCAPNTRHNVNVIFIMSKIYFGFHDFPMACSLFSDECWFWKKAETPTSCAPLNTMSMSSSSCQRIIFGFMIFQWLKSRLNECWFWKSWDTY